MSNNVLELDFMYCEQQPLTILRPFNDWVCAFHSSHHIRPELNLYDNVRIWCVSFWSRLAKCDYWRSTFVQPQASVGLDRNDGPFYNIPELYQDISLHPLVRKGGNFSQVGLAGVRNVKLMTTDPSVAATYLDKWV